jgi:surface antigen
MQVRFARVVISPLIAAGLLAGCTSTGGRSGGLFASGTQATPYVSALQGGIVGRTGVQMSDSDRRRALEAEYRALELSDVGQTVSWTGKGVSGQVVAAAPYQVGSQNCRQYTHTLTTEGREVKARGAACRNDDGTWTPLT